MCVCVLLLNMLVLQQSEQCEDWEQKYQVRDVWVCVCVCVCVLLLNMLVLQQSEQCEDWEQKYQVRDVWVCVCVCVCLVNEHACFTAI